MVSLNRGRFVVVHLYSTFSRHLLDFYLRGKFMPKIAIFHDFGGCKPTFFYARTAKFGLRVRTWDSVPQAKFLKIA